MSLFGNAFYGPAFYGDSAISPEPFPLGFGLAGKLGKPGGPDPLGVDGIYQMRMTKRGKVPVKMKFYQQTVPYGAAQLATQAKFAAAMAAWVALTTEQKASYTERAKKRQMFGWGLFIREYYQSH